MKGSFSVPGLIAVLCVACSPPGSPTGPSSVQPRSLSLESPVGVAGNQGTSALSGHGAEAVPFKGRLDGTVTVTPLAPPLAFVLISASGNATHLGRFSVAIPHTVNFATAFGEGTFTFTAANGDTLTADFTGQAQEGPIISIVEHATITGGTGRFAGATGSFTVERLFDPVAGTTTGSFDGTISSPSAGKD